MTAILAYWDRHLDMLVLKSLNFHWLLMGVDVEDSNSPWVGNKTRVDLFVIHQLQH